MWYDGNFFFIPSKQLAVIKNILSLMHSTASILLWSNRIAHYSCKIQRFERVIVPAEVGVLFTSYSRCSILM